MADKPVESLTSLSPSHLPRLFLLFPPPSPSLPFLSSLPAPLLSPLLLSSSLLPSSPPLILSNRLLMPFSLNLKSYKDTHSLSMTWHCRCIPTPHSYPLPHMTLTAGARAGAKAGARFRAWARARHAGPSRPNKLCSAVYRHVYLRSLYTREHCCQWQLPTTMLPSV